MCVCVCVCVRARYYYLSYPSCKAHIFYAALHLHMWPVFMDTIFPHYLLSSTIFGKKIY